MRSLLIVALLCALPSGVSAQHRSTAPVQDLSQASLMGLLSSAQGTISACANRTAPTTYVAEVRVTVTPGRRPSTMYNAGIRVSVRSRRRSRVFERCVTSRVRERLRGEALAVPRTVRAQRTFRVSDRPPPPLPQPRAVFSEAEARRALRGVNGTLARCIGVAGPVGVIRLYVAVDPAGRMVLQHASVPPGSSLRAEACLSATIARLQLRGHPERRVRFIHSVPSRSRAW